MKQPCAAAVTALCLLPLACATGGSLWLGDLGAPQEPAPHTPLTDNRALEDFERPPSASSSASALSAPPPDWIVEADGTSFPRTADARAVRRPADPRDDVARDDAEEGAPILIREHGRPAPRPALAAPTAAGDDVYRNTYYDFPSEGPGAKDAALFGADCAPLARVTTEFHDRVCVQGSGRLTDGATVSFARRGCACAAVCPRTSQQICFERLDPARFPAGRGATGRAITPLRTVAVDVALIPLGTPLYIPEYAGVARPEGGTHDGCFLAEDRGIAVTGRHIDVFTGDPATTTLWNAAVPSNRGVHVYPNHPFCRSAIPVR